MLDALLGVALVVFMAGNLLDMGLRLDPGKAVRALSDGRFVALTLLWCFVVSPGLAIGITHVAPLARGYATGLLLLGLAPGAPFLPAVASKAGADLAETAAVMLLAAAGTVVVMPVLVPLLVPGLSAAPWAVARPLVLFVLVPLTVGVVFCRIAPELAKGVRPAVRILTLLGTIVMLALVVLLYWSDLVGMVGSYAGLTLLAYCAVLPVLAYAASPGLPDGKRSLIALAVSTRNIGAAFAPLLASQDANRGAIAMCAVAVPITAIVSVLASRILAAHGSGPGRLTEPAPARPQS